MDWEEVKRLFHEALRDRRVLEGASGAVRAEVEELLRAHEAAPAEPAREGPGSVIGRYKLLQQIGEGGFGVVYMAEQTEPVRRKVALKVLKPGMDTGQVVARFEAERQALALMDHGNIAKVLDAGATAGGRPYFVMELVKGVPITQYCDEAHVDTRGRLRLFMQVCSAVQHAHQKGIIHRDLKPSNVLVTLHDGEPVPKVIDFGIAKAIDRRLTDKTLFTEFRQMIGTPDYMAPEQAELSGLDVDTRADVYSLGVLLYELLTGTKPFDLGRKGYEEIVRTIREAEPQRPSTRVSTMGEALLAVAQKRQTPPAILGRLLRGDLDWIVLKALEKDRARRYGTADGLALDVQRYLHDEPVHAMPASAAYRLKKFVRRHRVGVAAASVVILAVLLAAGGAIAGMGRARAEAAEARRAARALEGRSDEARAARAREAEQRARAEKGEAEAAKEAARADAILGFVDDMLSAADPHRAKGRGYTLRQLLDDFDRGLGERLRGEPEVEAFLRNTMGRAYVGLGLPDRAAPHLRLALDLRTRAKGEDSAEARESLSDIAWMHHERGDYRAAVEVLRRLLEAERRAGTGVSASRAAVGLSDMLTHLARYDEANDLCDEALAIQRRELGAEHPEVSRTLHFLALNALARGDLAGAERHALAHLAMERRLRSGDHPNVADALGSLAGVRQEAGDYADAERLQREALAMRVAVFGEAHPVVALSLGNLAGALQARGDLDGAEKNCRDAIARLRAFGEHAYLPGILGGLAVVLTKKRDLAGAEAAMREALALSRKSYGSDHPWVALALANLAVARSERGDQEEAERLCREALAMRRRTLGEKHADVGRSLGGLAVVLHRKRDYAQSEQLHREALAILRAALGDGHPSVATALWNLSALLLETGALAEAERAQLEAISILRAALGDEHFQVALARVELAPHLVAAGRCEEAERLVRETLPLLRRQFPADHEYTTRALEALANILRAAKRHADLETALLELLEIRRRTLGSRHPEVARTLTDLGRCRAAAGEYKAAEALSREALAIAQEGPEVDPSVVARCTYDLGLILANQQDVAGAMTAFREALRLQRAHLPPSDPALGATLTSMANLLGESDSEEASRLLSEAIPIWRAYPSLRPNLFSCLLAAGRHDLRARRFRDAAARYAEAAEMKRGDPAQKTQLAIALRGLASAHYDAADLDAAERAAREILSVGTEDDVVAALNYLTGISYARNDLAEAERLAADALERARRARGDADPATARCRGWVAKIAIRRGDPSRAEAVCREGLDAHRSATLLGPLGEALMAQGRHADAEPFLREACALHKETSGWIRYHAMSCLGESLLEQGKFAEAEPLLVEAAGKIDPTPESASRRRQAIERVVALYERWGRAEDAAAWRKRLE